MNESQWLLSFLLLQERVRRFMRAERERETHTHRDRGRDNLFFYFWFLIFLSALILWVLALEYGFRIKRGSVSADVDHLRPLRCRHVEGRLPIGRMWARFAPFRFSFPPR